MADTKRFWKELVTPDDLDGHMLDVGQAKINAKLVAKMFKANPLVNESKVYIPGCGTGQIFDYINPLELGNFKYLFSDIKQEFLEKLKIRVSGNTNFEILIDDVENSAIKEKVDAALIVLLLQHINWKVGLTNIIETRPHKLFIIIQEQKARDSEINKKRVLRHSIKQFSSKATTELVDQGELIEFLETKDYVKTWLESEEVPETKNMVGIVFSNNDY